jgi:O-antigen/teichoic acid export membrane protein
MSTGLVGLWRGRALRLGLSAAAIGATAITGILRNKWFAVHLDTEGIGVIGQVVATHTWLGLMAALGLGLPIARWVAAARGADDAEGVRRAVRTPLAIAATATAIVVIAGLAFAPALSLAILGDPGYAALVRISMLGAAGFALYHVVQGVFSGHSDLRPAVTIAVAGGGATVLAAVLLVPAAGVEGGVFAAALFFPVGLLAALLVHGRSYLRAVTPRPATPLGRAALRAMLAMGLSSLLLSLVDQGILVALRSHFLREHGIGANGLFQAALALSQQVGALFYAYITTYAFGRLSHAAGAAQPAGDADASAELSAQVSPASAAGAAAGTNVEAVRTYMRRQWVPIVVASAPLFALAMLASTPLLHLLYSDRFDAARPMMAWSLAGEFCRIQSVTWLFGAVALGRTGVWLAAGLAYPLVLAAAYPFCAAAGPVALSVAQAGAGVASLLLTGVLMHRVGVRLRAGDLAASVAATSGLIALAAWVAR